MPIYEYKCQDCGTKFEKLIRQSDAAEPTCPSCGLQRLERELSTFAAHTGGSSSSSEGPMCPSGGRCSTPGACGMNFN